MHAVLISDITVFDLDNKKIHVPAGTQVFVDTKEECFEWQSQLILINEQEYQCVN